jgi:hypothetical protein
LKTCRRGPDASTDEITGMGAGALLTGIESHHGQTAGRVTD